ncbi:acyl-CoA synthetase [Undibacterium arcticum]|uniref:Acyl-CoA synthetase n=1 Tax=Undibacterium arcticum TaxID=1762892 RepID=A0ABV7F9V6_9BURK
MQPTVLDQYASLYREFRWHVPDSFNIAQACCTRWANDPSRASDIAIHYESESGQTATLSYAELQAEANRLSNVLRRLGVQCGDRVALILPQRPEVAIALMACFQIGAIAMPLSILFGPDALEYRLQNSESVIAIVEQSCQPSIDAIRAQCPALQQIVLVDDAFAHTAPADTGGGANTSNDSDTSDNIDTPPLLHWHSAMAQASSSFAAVDTAASDPAILIYTSGTTGAPKGALLPQAALIGNLTGFVASQNWFPQEHDVFWSPADWAWTGGLMDALLPALYFGKPIVGYRGRFSAETAFQLLEKYAVTNTFLFPTALKIMMKTVAAPRDQYDLKLRAIMSAGEAVGDAVFNWCQSALGVTVNEMFGQTEMNYIVGNSAGQWPAKPGSMGRPYPGHRVAVIDDDGAIVAPGVTGEVALNRLDIQGDPDPIFFLGYWKNPQATSAKYTGDWCRTGDLASMDDDGYLWYQGRADDMFKAAGYRIGPSEIENCLVKHPAVANAAVVPKPDRERGNLVKAFVVLTAGVQGDAQLIKELQAHVRGKLAPYEYPKEIEFIDALPMTTTGKLQRRVLRLLEQERAQSES